LNEIGVVIIGRNEGERLGRCLASALGSGRVVVYVDSGSTDGSVALARSLGAVVVDLDMSRPFTAARARNAGLERLLAEDPAVALVQFVDGDCELVEGWLERARREFADCAELGAACGRLRERFPDRSPYNRLADIEWDTPVGDARACGGIVLMRVEALRQAGGFDAALIAGEEPELCVRLRALGWRVRRLDAEMALHDIAMTRFGQWWTRAVRAGFAYAQGFALHGRPPERHGLAECRSILFWAVALPGLALALAWPTRGLSVAVAAAAYAASFLRIARRHRRRGLAPADARLYAAACIVGKLPNLLGMARYAWRKLAGTSGRLIEYKGAADSRVARA
jgi:GT2 family glycosyltransferase